MVYIVVLNYQTWENTIECIESVLKLTYKNFKIVVVDNASPNNSMKYLEMWANGENLPNISEKKLARPIAYQKYTSDDINQTQLTQDSSCSLIFIQSSLNGGYAAGNNLGIRYAQHQTGWQYIWILNNDVIIEDKSLEHLINYAKKNTLCGIIGSKVMHYHNPNQIQYAGGAKMIKWLAYPRTIGNNEEDEGQYDVEDLDMDYVSGACMFITKPFLDSVGLLDEKYFLYYEEADWAIRGRRKKWKLGYCFRSKVYHVGGLSTGANSYQGKKKISKLSDFYFMRAKILFTKKFYPQYLITLYLSFIVILLNRIRRRQFDRVKMALRILLNPKTTFKQIK